MSVRSHPAQTLPAPARRASSRLRGAFGGSGVAWLLAPPLVFLALVLLVPLGYLIYLASQESGFSRALDNSIFTDSIPRTFLLAAIVTSFAMVLGTIYALALAVAPRWAAVLMLIALITLFWTSLLVRTYGWMILYFPRGPLFDALHAVGLRERPLDIYQTNLASYPAMVHVMLPFVVLPVYASLLQLDPLQVRAARVLGAKPLLILRSVVLPQLRAGMLAAGVLVFIMSLGFYVTPEMLGDPNGAMVAGVIGGQFNLPGNTSTAAAMSVLLVAVIVVVYAAADRLFGVSKHWGEKLMRAELRAGLGFGRTPFLIMGFLLAIFLLLPLLVIVPTSWTSGMLIEFPPRGFSLQWYDRMLGDPTWTDPLKVSLKIAGLAALLATFFGTTAALGMRRLMAGRSSALIRSLFILPMAIPYVSYALGVYNLFLDLPAGLSETIVPLVLAQSLITFPLVYIVVSGALSGVDPRLASAASTLGARWPTVVWRIELPLVRPAILAGALFAFATCFDEAVLAIFLAPIDQVTLAQQLYRSANEAIAPTLSAVSTSITLLAILVLGVATLIGRRAATRNGGTA